MNDDYLWDRSGHPDPETERLERLLGPLRRDHRADELRIGLTLPTKPAPPAWRRYLAPAALAASIVLLVGNTWLNLRDVPGIWQVERLRGTPTVNASPLEQSRGVRVDQWLVTDDASSARLSAADVGEVQIGPGSSVRLVSTERGEHRLELARGSLQAYIWAAPGRFFVDTPAATAIDLGCAYTLEVDARGDGRVRVTAGWVGLESGSRIVFVPAGATADMRSGRGPGTPHREAASEALAKGLALLDARDTVNGAAEGLDAVLAEAQPADAFTLWHLLSRLNRADAKRVCDRLTQLAPPPQGVQLDRVLAGDRVALDAWWDSLGLGEAALFRTLKVRPAGR